MMPKSCWLVLSFVPCDPCSTILHSICTNKTMRDTHVRALKKQFQDRTEPRKIFTEESGLDHLYGEIMKAFK